MPSNVSVAARALAELRAAARNSTTPMRDPRVAQRVGGGRTITIAETCQYYGLQTTTPTCRVPRSCQDCLRMPDCVLTGLAECVSVHELQGTTQYMNDYHHLLASCPRGNAYNRTLQVSDPPSSFFAVNATYCDAADPICTQCRRQFDYLATSEDFVERLQTQFCIGTGGCVCVAICEAPQARAPRVYDSTCGQPKPPSVPSATLKQRDRIMTARDPRSPPQDFLKRSQPAETCQFHKDRDVRGCRKPRKCDDCLRQPNCLLADYRCTSMDQYLPALDFRSDRYHEGDTDRYNSMPTAMFPSVNTTYCSTSDETCRKQYKNVLRERTPWNRVASESTFGVGQDGCVCIQACESDQWKVGVYDTQCTNLGGVGKPANSQVYIASGAIAVIVWIVLLALYKRSKGELVAPTRQTIERAGVRVLRHMLDEAPALGRLDLFGWRRFQERLAYKEQQLLQGEEMLSPVQPPLEFSLAASAPDFDEDDSSAPMTHDVRVLATAPLYRTSLPDGGADEGEDEERSDPWAPSAPDFDQDESATARSPTDSDFWHSGITRRTRLSR